MPLLVSPEVAARIAFRGNGGHRLEPWPISDGRYAVSDAALSNRYFAQWLPLLQTGLVSGAGLTLLSDPAIVLTLPSGQVRVVQHRGPDRFDIPAPSTYRFDPRQNDTAWAEDPAHKNRRCEISVPEDPAYYYSVGQTLWTSFSFVITPQHAPFDNPITYDTGGDIHNAIHQWHSVDDPYGIMAAVNLQAGNLAVYSRSSAIGDNGVAKGKVVLYNQPRPADGVVHNMVLSGWLGPLAYALTVTVTSGTFTVLVNGSPASPAYNATAATVRSALVAAGAPSTITVTGTAPNFVVSGLTAPIRAAGAGATLTQNSGHFNAWLNGVQIVNRDVPLGYYADNPYIAYPRFGIYQSNYRERNPLFIANPEWGTGSLLSRVSSPLAVNVPEEGWV